MVQNFNGTLLGDVLKSNDTIRDATTLENADPSDLRSVISMSTTAGFSVHSSNVYNSQGVSWDYTTLVKSVSVFFLSLSLVHEWLGDLVAFVNKSVSLVLDVHFLLLGQSLEVSNVQMSFFCCLFSSSLPNVRSKYFTAWSEDQMSACVMGLELASTVHVYFSLDS